jgi:hypothetical protein
MAQYTDAHSDLFAIYNNFAKVCIFAFVQYFFLNTFAKLDKIKLWKSIYKSIT